MVEFIKKEKRWAVRCDLDNKKVNAKPENLVLHRNGPRAPGHHIIGGDFTPAQVAQYFGASVSATSGHPFQGGPVNPSAWANGLSKADQYEWFSNCFQMRCDDDYEWGGGELRGPYNDQASPQDIADDFLVHCLLAHRCNALPNGWDWPAYLKVAV